MENNKKVVTAKVIVVDIDGTLSDASERATKYLDPTGKKSDWDGFYNACGEDQLIKPVIDFVEGLSTFYKIIFCSGRRESCRKATEEWFDKHVRLQGTNLKPCTFLFRKDGDTRHDMIVKPEMLNAYLAEHTTEVISGIIEDRNTMVAKWRELGYLCLQPINGDF